jgi:hypothetical protein
MFLLSLSNGFWFGFNASLQCEWHQTRRFVKQRKQARVSRVFFFGLVENSYRLRTTVSFLTPTFPPQKEKEGPNIHLAHCSLIPLYRKKEWIIQVDLLLYQKFPLFGVVVVKNKHKMGFSLILIILPVSKWSKNLHRKCKEYKMVPVSDSFTSKKWGGIQLLFDNNYKPLLFSNKNNLQNS